MKIIQTIKNYQATQHKMIKDNYIEVERSNTQLAYAILTLGCLIFIPFIIIAFTIDNYAPLRTAYLVTFGLLVTVLFLFKRLHKHLSFTTIVYSTFAFLIIYSIYTSAFLTPAYNSVIILLFLFQIPIIVIDKSWRVNLITVLYALIYLVIAIPFKDPRIIPDEILNCFLFTAMGIGLGEILRFVRLENYELKRIAQIHEKIDDLTKLHNRKSLFEYLNSVSSGSPIGLFLIDIDYFKAYNDTYGHQVGDDCLSKIGECFITFAKENQFKFFRYGGEEFVGLTSQHDPEQLKQLAAKLIQAIYELNIIHSKTNHGRISISLGINSTENYVADEQMRLLSQSDTAMYVAKSQGRNCFVYYDETMNMENIIQEIGH